MTAVRMFLTLITAISVLGATAASAQSSRRLEIGGQASLLRLSDFDATQPGVGGRVTFDLSKWLAADAEFQFFPNDNIFIPLGFTPAGSTLQARVGHYRRRADGFFGVKIGSRGQKYGLFAKVRPGFTHLIDRGVQCVGVDCARILMLLVRDEYRTEFALDLGGGVEFYPSVRTVTRVEFGDTMIRHRSFAPPCWADRCTSHNFSTRIGGGVRF